MTRLAAALLASTLLLAGAGCGSTPATVPDVTGRRLDVAEDTLDAAGLRFHATGGGLLGVVVRSHWLVCRQSPGPGAVAREVVLEVSRDCCRSEV